MSATNPDFTQNNPFRRIVSSAAILAPTDVPDQSFTVAYEFMAQEGDNLGVLEPATLAYYAIAEAYYSRKPDTIVEAIGPWVTPQERGFVGGQIGRLSVHHFVGEDEDRTVSTSIMMQSPPLNSEGQRTGIRLWVGSDNKIGPSIAEITFVDTLPAEQGLVAHDLGRRAVLNGEQMQLLDRGETESLATTKNPEALVPLLKGYNAALENIVAGVGAGTVVRTPLNKK